MEENLKGEQPEVKEAPPISEKKEVEPTLPEEKPTIRTYNQKELDEAVGKGRASTQSQLSLSQAETKASKADADATKAKVQAIEAELQELQRQHDDLVGKQFVDDPEARQAYIDRRAIADGQRKLVKDKAEVEDKLYKVELKEHDLRMAVRAKELIDETGIPLEKLEGSLTEEELELRTRNWQLAKEPEKEKEPPKFDSLVSSGKSSLIGDLSPRERTRAADKKLRV